MIDAKTIQTFMKTAGFYTGNIDGIFGPMSYGSAREMLRANNVNAGTWSNSRVFAAISQLFLNKTNDAGLIVDGLWGPRSNDALYIYNTTLLAPISTYWPRQRDVRAGTSMFGAAGKNQTMIELPYMMYGDYERRIKVTAVQGHAKTEASVKRVFQRVLGHYGPTQIRKLNLDIFSGCYNYRRTTGSSSLSLHSWGIAWDIDAAHNEFEDDATEAAFAKPIYAPFINFWEEEGWVSLGRARNYDWMHFQACRL